MSDDNGQRLFTLEEVEQRRAEWKRIESLAARYAELNESERAEVDRAVRERGEEMRRAGLVINESDWNQAVLHVAARSGE